LEANNSRKILQIIKKLATVIIVLLFFADLQAQDAHYSQYYSVPLYTNPALAGSYGGTYRIYTIYRSQWQPALQYPYRTFSAGGDFRFTFDKDNSRNPDYASIGLLFNTDKVAISDFNTTQILLTTAYQKSLDRHAIHYLGVGFQIGIGQKNINYENLSFEDQFNNLDGYSLSTSEILPPNNFGYLELALGINYAVTIKKQNKLFAGLALHHLNSPNVSFYSRSNLSNPDLIKEISLQSRFTAHLSYSVNNLEGIGVSPRFLIQSQGKHQEISVGANTRFTLDPQDDKYFHAGLYGRTAKDENAFGFETLIFATAYQAGNLVIGFSYDLNLSDVLNDAQGFNSFELSITYIGEHENDSYMCPEF
jgi:type IX secretion system PorP/SprF family membrane protein